MEDITTHFPNYFDLKGVNIKYQALKGLFQTYEQ